MGCSPSGGELGPTELKLVPSGWSPANNEHRVFICRFCGGATCKREDYKKQRVGPAAIKGLHSTFITSHVLGMQRPSEKKIKEHDILGQFKAKGIYAILNLQSHGEHPICGDGIDPVSGYSYKPETFMDAGIYFYNFGFVDMGVPTMEMMMRIVQVMSFHAFELNHKIAVHCHAGYGRTGIAIACWLCYAFAVSPSKAIETLRTRRPGCVQTKTQVKFVNQFASFLSHARQVFPLHGERALNLETMMQHQRVYLHGEDRELMKDVPKIVYLIVSAVTQHHEPRDALDGVLDLNCGSEPWTKQSEGVVRRLRLRINGDDWTALSGCETRHLIQLLLDFMDLLEKPLLPETLVDRVDIDSISGVLMGLPSYVCETLGFLIKLLLFCEKEGALPNDEEKQLLYIRFAFALFHPAGVRLKSSQPTVLPFRTLMAAPYDEKVGINSAHWFTHVTRMSVEETARIEQYDRLRELGVLLSEIAARWQEIIKAVEAKSNKIGVLQPEEEKKHHLEEKARDVDDRLEDIASEGPTSPLSRDAVKLEEMFRALPDAEKVALAHNLLALMNDEQRGQVLHSVDGAEDDDEDPILTRQETLALEEQEVIRRNSVLEEELLAEPIVLLPQEEDQD